METEMFFIYNLENSDRPIDVLKLMYKKICDPPCFTKCRRDSSSSMADTLVA